jgi:chromosome segregation ATPase
LTYPDLAEALQARILADLMAEKVAHTRCERPGPDKRRVPEAHIATLEEAVAKAQALGEQRRQEAQSAAKRVEALDVHIAMLEEAVAKAEALGEQRRQEAQSAAKRIEALDVHIAMLEEAVAKAEALGEQRRREAQTAAKRAEDLVAELVEMTSELVEMSKRMAEQTAATEKARAELDDYRSRSWWWQHARG